MNLHNPAPKDAQTEAYEAYIAKEEAKTPVQVPLAFKKTIQPLAQRCSKCVVRVVEEPYIFSRKNGYCQECAERLGLHLKKEKPQRKKVAKEIEDVD